MHWQTAPVGSDGAQLAYIDSGAPPTSTYTTLVFVHGHSFHAPIFCRLLPLAQEYNIRVIALNRRDYVNSTPLSKADLNILGGSDEATHMDLLQARGLEIAQFLCWVITDLKVLRVNADGVNGGLVLLGWSLGNLITLAFLAHLDTYPREVVKTLEPYLTSFFIYAILYMFLSYPNPPDSYNPFYIPENPMRLAPLTFATWVSSYYTHPAYSEPQSSPLLTPASFRQHTPEHTYRVCTTDTMSANELSEVLDLAPNARSERFYFDMAPSMLHRMIEKALLGADRCLLPSMKVYFVYGFEDVWLVTWAACGFERELLKWRAEGEHVRPIELIPVADANHFMHWDDARSFMELISKRVQSHPH